MADEANFKLQISYKLGPNNGDMLNVRASDPEEFKALLESLDIAGITEAGAALRAAGHAGVLTAPQGAVDPAPLQIVPQQTSLSVNAGKTCAHGAMSYREGQSARGPWKAYFCPAPKGDPGQCKPDFIK